MNMSVFIITLITICWTVNSIHYRNIASKQDSGLSYSRTFGTEWEEIFLPYLNGETTEKPERLPFIRQNPGVIVLDFDNDGDLDIFVSNGPDKSHSLFKNLLNENGNLKFEDIGSTAFDDKSISQDGSGACYADINNDGYSDILILGRNDLNLLYLNNFGDGTFTYIEDNGITQTNKEFNSASCSFGDINNDGLIDVVIGNAAPMLNMMDIMKYSVKSVEENAINDAFQFNEFNELYLNKGDKTFEDVSDRINLTIFENEKVNFGGVYNGLPTITWSIMMADMNNDGFQDIIHADDTLGAMPPKGYPKGIVHIFFNDGTGFFTDKPNIIFGNFMGNSAGDLNCDGNLDLFLSDSGGSKTPSQWYFNNGKGELYSSPKHVVTPFGWGNVIYDYDNDGDLDILFHGGIALSDRIVASNPGIIFENLDGCFANVYVAPFNRLWQPDRTCRGCTIHVRRNVRGVAVGDLNMDGLYDIITTSDERFEKDNIPGPFIKKSIPGPFQKVHFWFPSYADPKNNFRPSAGDLMVEIANNTFDTKKRDNNYFHITIKGSTDILNCGHVNRDAIGVLLNVAYNNYKNITIPIDGGSSHLSQNSLQKVIGMNKLNNVNLNIKYPSRDGGYIINKINNIKPKENLIVYEIPCDYNSKDSDIDEYTLCVKYSLCTLKKGDYISHELADRLYNDALDKNNEIIDCQQDIDPFCEDGNAF